MYNIGGLQKLCDILLENPSWTIAHLISYFNLTEHVNHAKVLDIIDEPDYACNMTPIQVWNVSCQQYLSGTGIAVQTLLHVFPFDFGLFDN